MQVIRRKNAKRLGFGLLILWGMVLLISIVFARYFEDILLTKIKASVDDKLKCEIRISRKDISFTWLKTFPFAGLQLDNLTVFEPSDIFPNYRPDTLVYVERCLIQFNTQHLLRKQIEIHRISFNSGFIHLKRFKNNAVNYKIWEPSDKKENPADSVRLSINLFSFKDIAITYRDIPHQVYVTYPVNKAQLKAGYSNKTFSLTVRAESPAAELVVGSNTYIQQQYVGLDFSSTLKDDRFEIQAGIANVGGIPIDIHLVYDPNLSPLFGCQFTVRNVEMQKLKGYDILDLERKYNLKVKSGKISLKGQIEKTSSQIKTRAEVLFEVKDAAAQLIDPKIALQGIYFNGNYTSNYTGTKLVVDTLSVQGSKSSIAGKFALSGHNLENLNVRLNGEVFMEDIIGLIPDSLGIQPDGSIQAELQYKAAYRSKTDTLWKNLFRSGLTGTVNANSIVWKYKQLDAIKATGSLQFLDKNILDIPQLTLSTSKSQLWLKGKIASYRGFFDKAFLPSANLEINAGTIDLREFIPKDNTTGSPISPFPANLKIEVRATCDRLISMRAESQQIIMHAGINPSVIDIHQLNFQAFDGSVMAAGKLYKLEKTSRLNSTIHLQSLSIGPLFEAYENFGQQAIVAENLAGKISAHVTLNFDLTDSLQISKPSIATDANIQIINGELVNYKPLEELSRFIDIDELKHVKFNELNTHLLIKDELITFDKTNIYSSAVDFSAMGTHDFDNRYEYHIEVVLSDILWGKARRRKQKDNEFGFITDDPSQHTSIPLVIKGKGEEVKVAYDKKTSRSRIKESLENQKTELGITKTPETKHEPSLSVVFEDDTLKTPKPVEKQTGTAGNKNTTPEKDNKKEDSEFIIEWEDD